MGWLRELIYGPPEVETRAAPAPRPAGAIPVAAVETPELGTPRTVEDEIAAAIARRVADFAIADALEMPAVIRAVQLICSQVAQFQPVAYRGGVPVPDQPRLLTQPAPFGTRYQFYYQTVYSLLAIAGTHGQGGDAFWLVVDRDELDVARAAIVLNPAEVRVEWDDARFLPVYHWRGQRMGRDLVHLTIGRPPGELHGRSPLAAMLPALAVVDAAERYAMGFFDTSGIPSVVIKAAGKGSPEEARKLKAQWMNAHSTPEPTPAVMFQGTGALDLEFPGTDAQKAQMQEARAFGNTLVSTGLGIPAPLLNVMTSGATITYGNSSDALDELVRATVAPVYLAPLEGYLSALMPRTQTVRFDTNELFRIDLAGRMEVYAKAIPLEVLSAGEARMFEGWPLDAPIPGAPAYAPTPALPALTVEVPVP